MSTVSKLITKYFEDFLANCNKESKEDILKDLKSKDAKKKLDDFVSQNNIRKRKTEVDKDSDMPKKPLSAFFIMSQEKRPQLKDSGVNSDFKSMTKALSKIWNDLKENNTVELHKYEEMSNRMKSEYTEKMVEYRKKHNIVEVEKPKSAFLYFKQANSDKVKSEFPGISNGELHKKMQVKWKELRSEKCETVKKFMDMSNKHKTDIQPVSTSTEKDEEVKVEVEVQSSPPESPIRHLSKKKKDKKDDVVSKKKKKKKDEVVDDSNYE